jgi:hypothetical protein
MAPNRARLFIGVLIIRQDDAGSPGSTKRDPGVNSKRGQSKGSVNNSSQILQ